uniref:Uncharacterized protein n=2 Tax=Oryza sativa subsp. japonica TaxID=39947 RepID=Q8LND4_ORYSJ|nr:Hypothetical protein [Oryza sativa Japonica Group]AAP53667.1 hypothetical protein LOC_Os10g26320 [Oryza sativa Japonica Group]
MENPNGAEGHLLPDEVEIDLNMLGPLVLNRIGVEGHRGWRGVELMKQLSKPGDLGDRISDGTVLGLGVGAGDRDLAFG